MQKLQKQSKDVYKEKIEQLKTIYPALFNDEGNLNEDELRNFLKQFASTSEGKYEFNWAGKMTAKRNAFTTSRAMLKPDKGRSIDFDDTKNLIIEGDNLEVLKLLQKSYQGKIKCIYIDPPYNTGKDFIYSDNFSEEKKAYWEKSGTTQDGVKLDTNTESQGRYHSNWLNMIYPRLLIARNLLKDDGVIFVSIDDNEVHNLRKVMDEVFGEENFVAEIAWQGLDTVKNDAKYFSNNHEYILCYGKEANNLVIKGVKRTEEQNKVYKNFDNDPKGDYLLTPLNAKSGTENSIYQYIFENGVEWEPPKGTFPRFSKQTLQELEKNKQIYFGKNNKSIPQKKTYLSEVSDYIKLTTFWDYKFAGSTRQSNNEITDLLAKGVFQNSKPTKLLKLMINSVLELDDLILDFFAGSGTTGEAVMELNKEDGGNRKYILVQIPEKTDESSEAYKAGYKKISDICIERVKRVSNKLKKEKVKGDLGFKVFTLSPSYFPENLFTPDPEKTELENKKALAKYIEEASTQLEFKFDEFDLMYEVLLKDGFTLNFKAEKIGEFKKNNIYRITDGEKNALLTLDPTLKEETLQMLQKYTEDRFICLERAVDTTKKWNLQNMFGSNLWVI